MKQLKGEGPGMEKQKAYQAVASTCHTTKDITHLLAEMKVLMRVLYANSVAVLVPIGCY